MADVLDAMFEKTVQPGEFIIRQGDDGDNFYVIERYNTFSLYITVNVSIGFSLHREAPMNQDERCTQSIVVFLLRAENIQTIVQSIILLFNCSFYLNLKLFKQDREISNRSLQFFLLFPIVSNDLTFCVSGENSMFT